MANRSSSTREPARVFSSGMATLDSIDLDTANRGPYTRHYASDDLAWAQELLGRAGSRIRVIRGEFVDTSQLPGWVAIESGLPTGLVTVREHREELELATIVAEANDEPTLSRLIEATIANLGPDCRRLWTVCHNAEFRLHHIVQREGLRLCALRPGAIETARRAAEPKELPYAINSVPVRDELEFELLIN